MLMERSLDVAPDFPDEDAERSLWMVRSST